MDSSEEVTPRWLPLKNPGEEDEKGWLQWESLAVDMDEAPASECRGETSAQEICAAIPDEVWTACFEGAAWPLEDRGTTEMPLCSLTESTVWQFIRDKFRVREASAHREAFALRVAAMLRCYGYLSLAAAENFGAVLDSASARQTDGELSPRQPVLIQPLSPREADLASPRSVADFGTPGEYIRPGPSTRLVHVAARIQYAHTKRQGFRSLVPP